MRALSLLSVFAHISWASVAIADSTVTLPFVDWFPGAWDFDEYEATVLNSNSEATTYEFNCRSEIATTQRCRLATHEVTIVAGPSTVAFEVHPYLLLDRTNCTISGYPSSLSGTCQQISTSQFGTSTGSVLTTFAVPGTAKTIFQTSIFVVPAAAATGLSTTGATQPGSIITSSPTTSRTTQSSGRALTSSTTKPANSAGKTGAPIVMLAGVIVGAAFGL